MKRTRSKRKKSPLNLAITFLALVVALGIFILDSTSHARLPQGSGPIELYSNQAGDDLRNTIVSAIESAEHSILLAVYNLSDGKVIKALKTKAETGIPVTVIVDAKASPQAKKALGPDVTTVRRSPSGLMHLKILVIDNKLLWIGSANMSYDSLRTHGNLIIGMDNDALASAISEYLMALPQSGSASPSSTSTIRFSQDGQDGDLFFLPPAKQALGNLVKVIENAQTTLKVAMFTWTHPAITAAVIDAHQRGVEVTAVIDSNQGQGAGSEVVHKLRKAGVPTYLSRSNGLLHYKMAIIDDTTLVIGSANWTRAAFSQNDDCFVVLSPLTHEQQEYLQRMWHVIIHESDRGQVWTGVDGGRGPSGHGGPSGHSGHVDKPFLTAKL